MSLNALVEVSRYYGNKSDYVLAGGGNTSWKDEETLYVKGSGQSLAEVDAASFVKMDRKALAGIWDKKYPHLETEREREFLSDMMAARKKGEEQKRPSVEALLHDIMPFAFVVHLHPALVNGLTCSQRGESAMKEIFDDDAIWIPSINPGYTLARHVKNSMDAYKEIYNKNVQIVFLQNHGVFTGADNTDVIRELYGEIITKIGAMLIKKPDFLDDRQETVVDSNTPRGAILHALKNLSGASIFMSNSETFTFLKDLSSFFPISSAFTPDHIVYAGSKPLFTELQTPDGIQEAWKGFVQETGRKPKIIAVQGIGIFGAAATEKAAKLALLLFGDAIKIAVYTESFGGPNFMAADKIDFINNWEAERFRASIST